MLALVVGVLVTAGVAPLVRSVMLGQGVLDVPNHRSSHTVPVPRGGGLACLAGGLAACGVSAALGGSVPWVPVVACSALAAVGFADDRLTLPPLPRLLAQCLAGAVMGWSLGGLPGLVLGTILTAAVVNVVNFMDGINGITALTMSVWGAVALLVGVSHRVDALTALGTVSLAAALGFLPWNAPVARLFLGDAGSYLFGAVAAAGLLAAWSQGAPVALVAAPLAVYAADTGSALIRRALRGEPLMQAHREHVYQQLTSVLGCSHLAVAAFAAGLAAVVALAWWVLPSALAAGATVLVCAVYLSSPALMGALRPKPVRAR